MRNTLGHVLPGISFPLLVIQYVSGSRDISSGSRHLSILSFRINAQSIIGRQGSRILRRRGIRKRRLRMPTLRLSWPRFHSRSRRTSIAGSVVTFDIGGNAQTLETYAETTSSANSGSPPTLLEEDVGARKGFILVPGYNPLAVSRFSAFWRRIC
jgi:hypothetical protein